jgi:hypothetical protein
MQKFSPLTCTQTYLDKILTFFKRNSRFSWRIFRIFQIWVLNRGNRDSQKASFIKFWAIKHFLKVFKTDLKFIGWWVFQGISKFQNSEYKVHQVGLNEACSQNFSFLALETAELAAPQISSRKCSVHFLE